MLEVKECKTAESSGLRKVTDTSGNTTYELRPGHEWYTQLYVHMITTKLDKGYIAVKENGWWKVASLELDPVEAEKLSRNIRARYDPLLARIAEEKEEEYREFELRKRGRPRKWRHHTEKRIFRKGGTLTNLDYDPNGDEDKKTVIGALEVEENGSTEEETEEPFLN